MKKILISILVLVMIIPGQYCVEGLEDGELIYLPNFEKVDGEEDGELIYLPNFENVDDGQDGEMIYLQNFQKIDSVEDGDMIYLSNFEVIEDENIPDLGICQQLQPNQTSVTKLTLTLGQVTPLPGQRCIEYTIPLNYKSTDIQVNSQSVNHMIISDKQITTCDENAFQACPTGSTVCINSKSNVESITSHQIGICLDFIYVYLYINCTSTAQYGSLYASYSYGIESCNSIDDSNMKVKCATFSKEICGNYDSKLCYEECAWIECTIRDSYNKNVSVYGQCVPSNLTKQSEWDDVCRANYQFNVVEETDLATGSNKAVAYPIWCGDVPPIDVAKRVADQFGVSENSVWTTFFTLLIFMFLLLICYYRLKFRRDGQPPFEPPSCCPNFIFPRTYQVTPLNNQRISEPEELTGYQPPQNL